MESIESKVETKARRILSKIEAKTKAAVDYVADEPVRAAYVALGFIAVVLLLLAAA